MSSYTVDRMDEIVGLSEAATLSETCVNYKVLDVRGRTIGRLEELFVNDRGEPEYVRIKLGLAALKRSVVLPVAAARVDEGEKTLTLQ